MQTAQSTPAIAARALLTSARQRRMKNKEKITCSTHAHNKNLMRSGATYVYTMINALYNYYNVTTCLILLQQCSICIIITLHP